MRYRILAAAMACALCARARYSADAVTVDEYVPAPGQFINTMPEADASDTPRTMADKCTRSLADGELVSLGGFGGYITFHFDHPVANVEGEYDMAIYGNANVGSAEPGIVMVSVDTNGNGLPDDPWYELSGSADTDSVGLVDYGYEIVYRLGPEDKVTWTDNRGGAGEVVKNASHTQCYYPLWLDPEIAFTGTLLPGNGHDTSGKGSYWVLDALRHGYVDNTPNKDKVGCSFDISAAVDASRRPVALDHVDFVRVYTALRQVCGWIGETSTEVSGAEDLHLQASLDHASGITAVASCQAVPVAVYSIDGRRLAAPGQGVSIILMSNGQTFKFTK